MANELIFQTVRTGSLDEVKRAINLSNASSLNREGQTLLHEAIGNHRIDLVQYLLPMMEDLNIQDSSGQTPLHFAAAHGDKITIDLLLKAGANPTVCDNYGNDPLWTATFNARGNYSIVALFKGYGANPLNKNKAGRSTIDFAKQINDLDLLKTLDSLN